MEKTIKLATDQEAILLYGRLDERLRYAEEEFKVRVAARNHRLTISGSKQNVKRAADFFENELEDIRGQVKPSSARPRYTDNKSDAKPSVHTGVSFFRKGKVVKAKSKQQEAYLEAIQKHDVVISIGPAGTGKTYLAVAAAIDYLKRKKVTRIILTRPAVEAGESLGFLPGDLYDKINPYLRPLYDALYDMMDLDEVSRYLKKGVIEVAPLAYMRGRTLHDSFVILDEGQNCTYEQMKMFLTRLGLSSRAVVTGDVTQIDLPSGKRSGLIAIQKILGHVEGIEFCHLDEQDVVRHKLVQDIIKAYAKHDKHARA